MDSILLVISYRAIFCTSLVTGSPTTTEVILENMELTKDIIFLAVLLIFISRNFFVATSKGGNIKQSIFPNRCAWGVHWCVKIMLFITLHRSKNLCQYVLFHRADTLCINLVSTEVALRNSSLAMQLCLTQVIIALILVAMIIHSVYAIVPSATQVWAKHGICFFFPNANSIAFTILTVLSVTTAVTFCLSIPHSSKKFKCTKKSWIILRTCRFHYVKQNTIFYVTYFKENK